jgi:hypothetical protein
MKKILCSAIVAASILTSCSLTKPVSASGTCFLGALCFGADASIQTAAKNGGITKVSTVDLKTSNVLGIIVTYTCIVTGE